MEIALGVARCLEYLHEGQSRPIIYRDLKSANVLLDHVSCAPFHPALCHCVTVTVTVSLCHCVTMPLCQRVTVSLCH